MNRMVRSQVFWLITVLVLSGCGAAVQQGPRQSAYESLAAPQRSRAEALTSEGELRGALQAWKVVLTIDPQDPVALEQVKVLDERIKKSVADRMARGMDALKRNVHLEARGHFLAVLALDPNNKEAFDALQNQVREVRQINHIVRAGESLASIAQFYYGDRIRSEVIWENNNLPANPKLTPGMVLKIPEIPGLPFGRPEASPVARPQPLTPTPAKPETAEDGLYANPALTEAKEAADRGDFVLALSTIDSFLGQNPRSSEAVDLKRTVMLQQGKSLSDQNKLADSLTVLTQLAKLNPKDNAVTSLLTNVRGRFVREHYNQGVRLFRDEKLPEAVSEWRTVLQYEPNHEGAKRNIEQAERLLKGLKERQQKQGR